MWFSSRTSFLRVAEHVREINFLIAYIKTLAPLTYTGVKLTLSGLVDGKNINAGGHKLGLGLELEA